MKTHCDIQITPEVLSFIAEIDEFKGAWLALETLAPERLSALRRVAMIEGMHSNSPMPSQHISKIGLLFAHKQRQEPLTCFGDLCPDSLRRARFFALQFEHETTRPRESSNHHD